MELLVSEDIIEEQKEEFYIARNLQRLLKDRNLNANQLSGLLGIPSMTVGRIVSGQTADPRVSTLKLIAHYLGVTVDSLMANDETATNIKPHFIPLLDWDTIQKINNIKEIDLKSWKDWQPIPPTENVNKRSEGLFAFISRPAMFPRYRHGSVLIIDCLAIPLDGDIVLVKIKRNNELSLRELITDANEWQLRPIVRGANILHFSTTEHQIIGVNQLTMLYSKR
ncbi:MAG: LexA family transcriptional regulator [Legionellales bacterium]|nr:LexA family transcriptional regulator [Legionellales bacterium]